MYVQKRLVSVLHALLCHLLVFEVGGDGLGAPRSHDGVLAAHAMAQGTVELGAEGKLLHVVRLLLGEDDTLGG